jgi:putative FmdB family regulatory protein
MPIYDYLCQECGHEFECLLQKDSKPPACPSCGCLRVARTVSRFSCLGVQMDKRLRMDSEEKMARGRDLLKKQKLRKNRITIL